MCWGCCIGEDVGIALASGVNILLEVEISVAYVRGFSIGETILFICANL